MLLAVLVSACPGSGRKGPSVPEKRVLTVRTQGPGAVVSEPNGIYCGDTCAATFNRGSVVTLAPRTGDSAVFTGWRGACTGHALCMVTMDADRAVTATWTVRERPPVVMPGDAIDAGTVDPGGDNGVGAGGDRDGDGISDVRDGCPDEPEDLDGFEDADGCPDLDNDADGIADVDDLCPNASEDRDGFEEEDGCPDPDNDRDGILDFDDQCPFEPETMNGFDDQDGCPDRLP